MIFSVGDDQKNVINDLQLSMRIYSYIEFTLQFLTLLCTPCTFMKLKIIIKRHSRVHIKKKNTFTDVHGLFADFTNVLILIPHFSTHDTGTNIN